MRRLLHIAAALLLLTVGCGKRDGTTERSNETMERLSAIDDSIAAMSPAVKAMISRGMADADDSITWYEFYMRYGKYYLTSQYPDSMLPYADRAVRFAESRRPSPRINGIKALAYELKADYLLRYRSNLNEAIRLRSIAYDAIMESGDKSFAPEMCANMADTYVQLNDMAQAASWYRRALFLVDSLRLPDIKNVTLYLGLAQIYMNLEDYDSSLKYYADCGRFYDSMPVNMRIYYLNNFGNYYYYRHDYAGALRMFLRLKGLLESYGDNGIDMSICRVNLADVYLNLDSIDTADGYVTDAERFFEANGIVAGIYYANSIRIAMAARRGQTAGVEKILAGERFAPPTEYNLVGIRNRYLREHYIRTGNWRAAYENLSGDITARDSIEEAREHMRASEIMQRLKEDTLTLHHAMEIQEKDSALRATRISVATTLVVAVLLMLWLAAYTRKRRLQGEMDIMRLKLDNVRNRISPHFIFNVLNNHIGTAGGSESDKLLMLAKLIRANLDISRNTLISLAEEMKFVRYYVDVESTMLGDDFTFTVDAPEDSVMDGISIPTMFVQILVENSLKHGLKGKAGPKRLDITVRTGPGGTDITIADNGNGFDIRRMGTGRERNGLDIIRHTMRIVNERRKGGDAITFDISNRKDGDGHTTGCVSRLHIPAILSLPDSSNTC